MVGGGWLLDFTRLMLISTQVGVVVEVGVELGKMEILSFGNPNSYRKRPPELNSGI